MNAPALAYCSRCQESVKPMKGIVIYRCPACGAPVFGYSEQPNVDPADPCDHEKDVQQLAVA